MSQTRYTAAVLADSPWAFYKFDEASGNPQDSSGNARHITSTDGTPTYQQAGPFTGSFSIRSANSHQFNRTPSSMSATTTFAVEFWIKSDGFTANDQAIWNVGNAGSGFQLFADSDSTFQAKLNAGGGTAMTNSYNQLSTANFRHIVITRDSGVWKYYVDGAIDNIAAGTAALTDPSAQPMQWNQDFGATSGQYISNGAFYTASLSAAQVLAHYQAGVADPAPGQFAVRHVGRGATW